MHLTWLIGLGDHDFIGLFGRVLPREATLKSDGPDSQPPVTPRVDVLDIMRRILDEIVIGPGADCLSARAFRPPGLPVLDGRVIGDPAGRIDNTAEVIDQ